VSDWRGIFDARNRMRGTIERRVGGWCLIIDNSTGVETFATPEAAREQAAKILSGIGRSSGGADEQT
jgi:hypothetical protein